MSDADLLVSPVHDRHTALDATLGEFGGWSMPISYPDGTVAEHTAVRESAGLFDVSHLGTVPVTGPGAAAHLNACLTADLDRIEPGRAQYTMACTPDGGVLDDMIAYLSGPDDVLLVPNASNSSQIVALLRDGAPDGVEIVDRHRDLAVLAVQGPRSAEALRVALGAGAEVLDGLDYMAFRDLEAGAVRVCRSGYTGEHGYELVLEAAAAPPMWDALLDAVREVGGLPCGLAARDTLRTEMGYPLHGHELSDRISPLQANSGWAVGWDKPAFWGREALLAEKEKGPVRRLRALRATGRGVPRAGMSVLSATDGGDGARTIGTVTSGTFSPTLKTGIALALIDSAAGVGPGSEVAIEVRGRSLTAEVVKPPFVESHVR